MKEQKRCEEELQKAMARNDTVSRLYEKLYEDNATRKVSDEWFMQLSHKYEVERMELKSKITALRKKLSESGKQQQQRESFILAVRRFMQMDYLTAPLLRELIDHIDVFETEGTGKNRTLRIVIYYRFVAMWRFRLRRGIRITKRIPAKESPSNTSLNRKQHNEKEQTTACSPHQTVPRKLL